MMRNNNAYAACNVADSRERCLVNVFSSIRSENEAARDAIRNFANEGFISESAAAFAVLFSAVASFGNVLNLSRELSNSHSL